MYPFLPGTKHQPLCFCSVVEKPPPGLRERGWEGSGGQLAQTFKELILWEEEAVAYIANPAIFQNFMEKALLKITVFKKKKPFTNDKILSLIRSILETSVFPISAMGKQGHPSILLVGKYRDSFCWKEI